METFFVISFLVLIVYLLYSWIIYPKKMMAHYTRMFKSQGYRVIELPFRPFGSSFLEQLFEDQEKNKDPYYTHKRSYSGVDVLIGNSLNHPNIVFMNIDMVKDMLSPEKMMSFEKEKETADIFFSFVKKGILAIEGN
jgi:hypothetical protein